MSHSLASAQNEKCRLNTHLNTFSQHFCSNLIKINRPFHLCVWLVINMCCFEFGFDVDRKCTLRLFLLEFWFFFPFLRRIEYSRVQLVNTHGYVFVRWLWVFCSQNLLTFFWPIRLANMNQFRLAAVEYLPTHDYIHWKMLRYVRGGFSITDL